MAFTNGNGKERRMMSDINIVPLVDVMLVLLIIFMVTAPMLTQGVDVNLPQANAKALRSDEERLVITVDMNSRIFVGKQPVEFNRLNSTLQAIVPQPTPGQPRPAHRPGGLFPRLPGRPVRIRRKSHRGGSQRRGRKTRDGHGTPRALSGGRAIGLGAYPPAGPPLHPFFRRMIAGSA